MDIRAPARLRSVGTAVDDSARLGSLIGACWGNGSLIRSAPFLSAIPRSNHLLLGAIDPDVAIVFNSRIPDSFNDGSLWAGRGLNTSVSAGVVGSYGRFRFALAPRLNVSQNRPFAILPSGRADRSAFASPWRSGVQSGDFPLRFGTARYSTVDPGETMVEIEAGPVAFGVTSAAAWWGPGIRNALMLSNNAGGIPQAYVRTAHPVVTRLGEIEGQWLLGQLVESPFFDRDPRNDARSLSAAGITLRPVADTGLRVGVSRAVYASAPRFGRLVEHVADVFIDWQRRSESDRDAGDVEQLTSVFAKWTIPEAGLAAHFEWTKARVPRSLRDLLVNPQESQGFTLGLEWAKALSPATRLRVQSEFTSLEQTPPVSGGETQQLYTSAHVPQGYSHQGQSIGASIGPGSSSQYLGFRLYRGEYQLGLSAGRVRWAQDAYYREPSQGRLTYMVHDVSLYAGLTGLADLKWGQVELSWTPTLRMNYLFQTVDPFGFGDDFDVRNQTLSLRITPHVAEKFR